MFDLFRNKKSAMRYLMGAMFGLIALSLVITMVPGMGAPTTASDQLIAKIGDDPITITDVQMAMQNVTRNGQIPPEMRQFYVPQLIDQMIAERAVAYQAERMGFEISEAELAQAIRSMLSQLFPSGEFDRQVYERFLAQQGLTVSRFEQNVRTNLLKLRLENVALEGMIVTPQEVEQEYKRKNDKVKLDYVVYNPGDLKSQVTVTPEEIRTYFEANKARFMTPERRSLHVLIADESRIGAVIQVDEAQLRALYNQNADRFRTPERVKARHILVQTTGKSPEETKQLEAKANDLLKQVRAGGDFAELAKKNSDDTTSGTQGGDLGWVTRGQMVKPFEESVFSLKPKEISNIVRTEYGFHIVQALERENARMKPFEEVRAELETEAKRESVFQRMQQGIDQARAELGRNPQAAEQIAAKYNLVYTKAENLTRGMPIPEIGPNPEMDANIGALRQGEVSPVVQVSPTRLAIAAVTAIEQPRPAELAQVEGEIRETVTNSKTEKLAEQKINEMKAKLQSAGPDLNAAAKSLGLEVKSTQFFNQEGAADGIGPATYVKDAFVKPVGSVLAPFNLGNQLFLAKVTEKQPADPAALASQRDALILALKRDKAQLRRDLFQDGLVTQLIREGKIKKNEENIKRLVTGAAQS